ncbi:MAG: hypothetical protein ABWY55_02130, partial [Microbacterium sp.]
MIALLGSAMTGCSAPPEPAEPTPVFTSEDEAFAAAEETYRAYVDALNQVDLSDPETFEDVYAWTTGELNATDRTGLSKYHAEGVHVAGASAVVTVEPADFSATFDLVTLATCLDVSEVVVLDRDGNSLVDPDRVDVQSLSVTLVSSPRSPTSLLVGAI